MRALHVRLTIASAALLAGLAIGLLLLLSRTSDRYSDEVLQRLNSGIAPYVVKELPLLAGGKVNEAALHELAHRTMTVNPSAEVYLLDPFGRVLARASRDREEVLVVDCDPALIEETRRHWPFLRDRRIDAYGGITHRFLDRD